MLFRLFALDGPRRLLDALLFRDLGACITAYLAALLFGRWFIRHQLERRYLERADKGDSQYLLELHSSKKHTPTMGGFILWFGWLVAALLWGDPGSRFIWLSIATALVLGAVGFADDFVKLKDPKRPGISARAKLAFQLVWGLAVGTYLYFQPLLEDPGAARSLYFPLLSGWYMPLGLLFIPLVSLVVTSSSNAVNLTDGLDGLAMGCSILAAMVLVVVAWFSVDPETSAGLRVPFVPGIEEVSVLAAGLVGAGLGFLWFNCHPAQIFMGDTGSLPLGGLLGLMAVLTKQELLFALAGGVFVIEALSVILQVASFKLRRKRIFLIAPLHHHYQFKGWSETKVTVRFWILAMILTGASLVILRLG